MNAGQPSDFTRVLGMVLKHYKMMMLITLAVMGSAFAYTQLATPVYESQAQVAYQAPPREANPAGIAYPTTGLRADDMRTLVGYANASSVRQAAAKGAGVSLDEFNQAASVIEDGNAAILSVTAKAGSADTAQGIADAYATAIVADRTNLAKKNIDGKIKNLETSLRKAERALLSQPKEQYDSTRVNSLEIELSSLRSQRDTLLSSLVVSNPAKLPDAAVWPRTFLTMIAALMVGLGLGAGAALLRATTDRKLRSEHADLLPAPVLVKVPRARQAPKMMPLGPSVAEPIVADAFAALGSRVMLERGSTDKAHIVLVASARANEGKSTVAANLASALAQSGRRVILVDADLRRPTQDLVFPTLQGRPGLAQVLTGASEVEQALTLVAPNLAAIASGPRQVSASTLLASVNMRSLLDRLAQISDIVIVDAPPVLPVTDSLSLAPAADQVLLCARIGSSNLREINDAHMRLAGSCSTPQAIVMVGSDAPTGYGYEREARGLVTSAHRPVGIPSQGQAFPSVGSGTGQVA